MKVRKDLREEIEVPEEITVNIGDREIIMRKDDNELRRKLNPLVDIKMDGKKIILGSKKATKNEKKIFGTIKAHINNMIIGLTEKFKYKLQVASVHFPITTQIDKDKNEFVIKNFLGEKKDRKIKLIPEVDVKIDKDVIELESADIEKAGQFAANLEKGTKVRNKDRRIFQDGIFIVEKPGRTFL